MEMASLGNQYFDHEKPWVLKKDVNQHKALESVIYTCLEAIRLLALVAMPLIPSTSHKILDFLGLNPEEPLHWDHFIHHCLK
jgi:methionyl-tRNA synthetase